MGGITWIKVATDLRTHRKSLQLGVELQDRRAWSYVVALWMWASQQAEDGRVTGPAAVPTIEAMSGWDGPAGALVEALTHCGFIDEIGNGFRIHDWDKHAGAQTEERVKAAKRKRDWRKGQPKDVPGTERGRPGDDAVMSPDKRERERETQKETEKERDTPVIVKIPR